MFLLVISVLSNNAQPIYQIPWAQQQPKFVFPIYFEDGTGEKDTLYLGYDSLANGYSINTQPNHDTVFGVRNIIINQNKFHASWIENNCDSNLCGYKVNVTSMRFNYFPSHFYFTCPVFRASSRLLKKPAT